MADIYMNDASIASITTLPSGGLMLVWDPTDTTDTGTGTQKKITFTNFLTNLPAYDMLSTLVNSEVSVTGATTATISKMHTCSGTSANYTVSLPSTSGNAKKLVGLRMLPGLTKLVTIDAGAGVTIGGKSTTLSGSITSGATTLTVASAAGFPAAKNPFSIQIDSEVMNVTAGMGTTTWTVTRGANGTTAASHTSGASVDWNRTLTFWANESIILLCDGSNWFKIAGVSIPMACRMRHTIYEGYNNGINTKVTLDTLDIDNTGLMAGSSKILILRTGVYAVKGAANYSNIAASTNTQVNVYRNGSVQFGLSITNGASSYPGLIAPDDLTLFAGDYLELWVYQTTGTTVTLYTAAPTNYLNVVEQP